MSTTIKERMKAYQLLFLLAAFLLLPPLTTAFSSASKNMASGPFCLNVKVQVRPDQRDQFLECIKLDQKGSIETEPACLQFVVGEDTTTPNTFYFHEEYVDEDGHQYHTKTPHFAEWKAFCDTNPWSNEEGPEVDFYKGTHVPEKFEIPKYAYCLNVNLYPRPEVRDEFLKVIAANKAGTDAKEPLALQYVYGESTTVPNVFHFHEQYTGEDAGKEGFDAHTKAPHFGDWEAFASKDVFVKPPVVSFFKTI